MILTLECETVWWIQTSRYVSSWSVWGAVQWSQYTPVLASTTLGQSASHLNSFSSRHSNRICPSVDSAHQPLLHSESVCDYIKVAMLNLLKKLENIWRQTLTNWYPGTVTAQSRTESFVVRDGPGGVTGSSCVICWYFITTWVRLHFSAVQLWTQFP